MRKTLKVAGTFVAVGVVGYALWLAGRTAYFYSGPAEKRLSQTGFDLRDAEGGGIARTFRFQPKHPFWSDGANKLRYVQIPAGTKIDNGDPDRWNFPQGTRIWKVFERDETYVETRMLYKTGPAPWEWDMAVYAPRATGGDSTKLALARRDVGGTDHDIPAPAACVTCHSSGDKRRPLGLTAMQLPWTDAAGLSQQRLIDLDLLTHPPAEPYEIPGDAVAQAALGYFDTNCGSCHYEGSTYVSKNVPLRMNLTHDTLTRVETTNVYRTAIDMAPHLDGLGTHVYVEPGEPERSFLYRRMSMRDGGIWQMPPLATEIPDLAGLALVKDWILSLGTDDGRSSAFR